MYRQIGSHGISQMIKLQTEKANNNENYADHTNLFIKNDLNLLSGESTIRITKKGSKKIRNQ